MSLTKKQVNQPGRIHKALGVKVFHTVDLVLIARDAGYDTLFIDLEHSQASLESASQLCKVAKLAGILPLVRVPDDSGDGFIQRVLDGGAKGVIFPHICNAGDVKKIVQSVKYAPMGTRSLSPSLLPGGGLGLSQDKVARILEQNEVSAIVMIENTMALDNLDEIAAVPGLDMMLIGSMDMTFDLGILGQWDSPLYQKILVDVSSAAQQHGKLWGISGLFGSPEAFADPIEKLGVNLIVGAIDRGLLLKGAKENVNAMRSFENDTLAKK
ncbi:hypothetical protein BBP40_008394 [Aspergillus hancockii]|nr:hypothetical protein BBP40_008394 [Aspergillus hancockii]